MPKEGLVAGTEAMDSFKGVAILVLIDLMEFAMLLIEFVALFFIFFVIFAAAFATVLTAELAFGALAGEPKTLLRAFTF
jgi:hypothetical protein